jgi:hypothetical protein
MVTNSNYSRSFMVKMFFMAIPLPICVIVGSNTTFEQVDTTSDVSLFFNMIFGISVVLFPFNWIHNYMKNAAIDEKNSKLET